MPRHLQYFINSLLINLLFLANFIQAEQRIIEEPEDTVAKIGETVILKCKVQYQRGQVLWMKGDIGLGTKRDLPFWERMSMVGSLADGDYHLEIRNVTLDDEDTYQCQLSSTDDEPIPKLSRKASLTVIVEPKLPTFIGESISPLQSSQQITATEGQSIRISCQSSAGKPPAKITWAIAEDKEAQKLIERIENNGSTDAEQRHLTIHPMRVREHSSIHPSRHGRNHHLNGNITEVVEFNENSQLYTTISHLIFAPRKFDNGRWLICISTHPAYGMESRTTSIEMDIYYAPKVRVEIDMAESKLYEGGFVQFRCLSDARPNQNLIYNWHWDSTEKRRLNVKNGEQARIDGLRFNDNGKRVSCTVENSIGTGSGALELDVPFGPQFMSTNQTKTVDRGSEVTFQCEVLGNPQPIVRWYHGRDWETPIFEGKNFTIQNAQDWEEGEYRCTAEVNGFPPKTLHHLLYLKGPPKVRLSEYIILDGGTKIVLVCEIQSRAMPLRVHWFHNGHRVDIEHSSAAMNSVDQRRRYDVQDEKVGRHELISRLTINEFGKEDFGKWNCSAKNDYGLVWDQREIEVIGFVEKFVRYAQGLPMKLQICILAIALFILLFPLLLCCLCRKCCCRPNGHSKLSSHSSDQRGEFSGADDGEPSLLNIIVKCEELDGLTNSSTPPYPQMQHYYTDPLQSQQHQCDNTNFICSPAHNPAAEVDQSIMYGQQQEMGLISGPNFGTTTLAHHQSFNEYFNNGVYSPATGPHLVNAHNTDGIMMNGGFGSFCTNDGGNNSFNGSTHSFSNPPPPGPMNPYDSFGIARALQSHQQQPSQQYFAYTGPTQLEPVTEVCTPESHEDCGQLIQTADEPERPISRISTHV